EHIAAFSEDCGPYFDRSEELFDEEPRLRSRILIGAEGRRLYSHLKSKEEPDLFSLIGDEYDLSEILKAAARTKQMSKFTVCMLLVSPKNETPLRLDEEARDVLEKLKNVESPTVEISIRQQMAVRLSDFTDHLLNSRPQIVHFSGHGGGGTILFENAIGEGTPLTADGLAGIIDAVEGIQCVILNACNSADLSAAVKSHVKVVIGCDDTIADEAAITFTRSFYRSLAHGKNFQQSFKIAVADVKAQHGQQEGEKYTLI
ncbi:CHAT domain-containing protein, partial [Xanthobacter autotrophicus]|uniref:CHAT domain-containing protein n=1 Tax=Xanthobacter autotrophicus TaxID=280 RepID=UPI003728B2E5